ncbi:Phosphomethylpyrimidine kinase-domain-containing protein [Schizophyllum amplum]|uniref:Phosphomethylpyrimidine kinase-domain-containing protein n=1 Tax=Schizophyllum amplum TaxID=97359 RepID=A0A550CY81_9AGAR|nr:Phosphomethylpyrimidine kinase-domain-containing protein [Auriculariopsis ampla]
MTSHPGVLTIAGSDSGGGAGIQADLKTIAALGCYGSSAITALTAQNTRGVQGVHPVPVKFVESQIHVVLADIDAKAIKTGMLYDAQIASAVVRTLKAHYREAPMPALICDPVCVSTSGHTLLRQDAVDTIVDELFPIAALITPNKQEAELLLARRGYPAEIKSLHDMLVAADALMGLGSRAVLLKGGHITATLDDIAQFASAHPEVKRVPQGVFGENMEILQLSGDTTKIEELVVDILYQTSGATMFYRPRIDSQNTHGTGCTLSSALASFVAQGYDLVEATRKATEYTHFGIQAAYPVGGGHGPLDHLHGLRPACIPARTPTNKHPFTRLLIQQSASTWKAYVEHPFVVELGKGTLAKDKFVHFIKQDYHYLKYYARAYALLAAKATTFGGVDRAVQTILNVLREINTHKAFCGKFGVTEEELESTPEASATTAYGCYLIETGLQGDSMKLTMALLACLLGYGEVGLWLKRHASAPDGWVVLEGNTYLQWIEDYSGENYQSAVKLGLDVIESRAAEDPPSPARFAEWAGVWQKCTQLEKGFWDMAMNLSP